MKKIFFIAFVLILSLTKAKAQSFNYIFSINGVDVYGRWSCDDCSDRHYSYKITNNNPYRIKWSYDKFMWINSNGTVEKTESGGSWWLPANSTQNAGSSGLWFYPPNTVYGKNLRPEFKNFNVIKD